MHHQPLAEVSTSRHYDAFFGVRHGRQRRARLISFLRSHPAFQDNHVLSELRKPLRDRPKVLLALCDHDGGSPGFESGQDVVENHVITGVVAAQKGVEFLNGLPRVGIFSLGAEPGFLDRWKNGLAAACLRASTR